MRLEQLILKDGASVALGTITVLVGPNNSGKTRTLLDVRDLIINGNVGPSTTLVSSVVPFPPATELDLVQGLTSLSAQEGLLQPLPIMSLGSDLRGSSSRPSLQLANLKKIFADDPNKAWFLEGLGQFRVANLEPTNRLNATVTVGAQNRQVESPPENLLQALFIDKSGLRKKFYELFKNTFEDMEIRLDYTSGTELCLRVAKRFPALSAEPLEAAGQMKAFRKVDDEGSGYRSFTTAVLSVMLAPGRVILLDEPEAFLHPAQARKLGRWLGDLSKAMPGQILVATHNAPFLEGVLTGSKDAAIIRLNRAETTTTYTRMSPDAVLKLVHSPLLSSQRVHEGIFHRGVVVCEGDGDRAVYQAVAQRIHDEHETLFVNAQGKQTVHRVIELLKTANVPAAAVVDFDILDDAQELERLHFAVTGKSLTTEHQALRNAVDRFASGAPASEVMEEIKKQTTDVLAAISSGTTDLGSVRRELRNIADENSLWTRIKREGLNALPSDLRTRVEEMLTAFAAAHLYVVPSGALESWIPDLPQRKDKWVLAALVRISEGKAPETLSRFVRSLLR